MANSRIVTRLTLLCLSVFTSTAVLNADQKSLDLLADQIAAVAKHRAEVVHPRIVVSDFPETSIGINSLGSYIADILTIKLSGRFRPDDIIPRSRLLEVLGSYHLSSLDLQSVFTAYWAADQLGANEIIVGEMTSSTASIALNVKLVRIGDAKEIAAWNLSLPMDSDLNSRREKPLELPDTALRFAFRCGTDSALASKAFINSGGTVPKCVSCTNPPYSEEARREKLSAARIYDTFIDRDGSTLLVIPHRPLRPEFDNIAVQTLSRWKFHPATKDREPVPVCVAIEINSRLY